MKKLFIILSVLLVMLAAGCGSPGQATQQSKEDKQVKVIQTALGCSNEIAKKSSEIIKTVELDPLTKMEVFNKEFNTWKTTTRGIETVVVATKDKGVTKVLTRGKVLYENEKVLMKASDFLVTQTDSEKCRRRAQRVVKEQLKDPDSVKFDDKNWGTEKKNGMYIAQGVFRAKNSFGVYVLNYYTVTIDKDFNVKSVKIDPYK